MVQITGSKTPKWLAALPDQQPAAPVGPGPADQLQQRRGLRPKASLSSLHLATLPHRALQVPPHAVMTPLFAVQDYFLKHLVPATPLGDNLLRAHLPAVGDKMGASQSYFVMGGVANSGVQSDSVVRGIRKIDKDVGQIYVAKEFHVEEDFRAQLFDSNYRALPQQFLTGSLVAVANEVNIQAAIAHPMTPHFSLLTPDKLIIVMPLMGANVMQVLQGVGSEQNPSSDGRVIANVPVRLGMAFAVLQGGTDGLLPLHQQGAAHRDIKPENMALRRDGVVYLIDFGTAQPSVVVDVEGATHEPQGSLSFRPPEAHLGTNYDGRKADIWGLGLTVLVTLLGDNPTQTHSLEWTHAWQQVIERGSRGLSLEPSLDASSLEREVAVVHQQLKNAAPKLYPLIVQMLDVNPAKRPSVQGVRDFLDGLKSHDRPDIKPLLDELRAQSNDGRLPMADAIDNDALLMRPQPGEQSALRPSLRRANSVDTLMRPFISPFDADDHNVVGHKGGWRFSPRFEAVRDFLWQQEFLLLQHLVSVRDVEKLWSSDDEL